MAVASGLDREIGGEGGGAGTGSKTRTERGLGSRGSADRRACSLWSKLTYALSMLYSTAAPPSSSRSHTHLRVCPARSAVRMSGQALRIKESCSSVSPYLLEERKVIYRRSRRSLLTQEQKVSYPIRMPSSPRGSQTRFRECPSFSAATISGQARRISAIL